MALKGVRVFMSRKDFPSQFIDSSHDMLRENGAEICICSNISCNASTDVHVIPSSQHERVAEYLSNGCNVIGQNCDKRGSDP
ncbi:hypothetical protein GOP47_0027170 [Adiantum capillus-veneris]|nr:hypothetical protein GOP47_0027170 [Adiantum capillus-veneris]